jgi:hypothetical protein
MNTKDELPLEIPGDEEIDDDEDLDDDEDEDDDDWDDEPEEQKFSNHRLLSDASSCAIDYRPV